MTRHLTPIPSPTEATLATAIRLAGALTGDITAGTPIAGPGDGWITLSIGGVSLRFDDLDALESFDAAWATTSSIGRLTLSG